MKFAFSRPTSTTEERNDLFLNYQSLGYDGLQLKLGQYAPYLKEPERFLYEWNHLDGLGSALIFGGDLSQDNQEQFKSLLSFGEKIGTERIVFCHGVPRDGVDEEQIRTYAFMLSELGQRAQEEHGIQLSLHHHYNQPVMYRKDLDIFFDEAKPESVTLTVDTAHLFKSGVVDIAEVIDSFRDQIDNFHMKDFANGDWKVLGEGVIDFNPIFEAINRINFDGWISADEESGGEIIGGMNECYSFMKEGLRNYSKS